MVLIRVGLWSGALALQVGVIRPVLVLLFCVGILAVASVVLRWVRLVRLLAITLCPLLVSLGLRLLRALGLVAVAEGLSFWTYIFEELLFVVGDVIFDTSHSCYGAYFRGELLGPERVEP